MITPDPTLAEYSDTIERRLAAAVREITPESFRGLIGDPGLSVLRSTKDCLEADSMSIWLADAAGENLVVTHTEPEVEFIGWSQSVDEGLISLAYVSEQSLCENQVYLNADHSKRVDEALEQVTCALIATPLYIGGTLQGVVSCVQLKDGPDAPDPGGFTARNMNRVRRLSTVLERLANYRLLSKLLGIEL